MNREEAKSILVEELAAYRKRPYSELLQLVGNPEIKEVDASSGRKYQLEFQAMFDDSKNNNLRVVGSIDDGGFRAFAPVTEDFIVTNEGKFVGEHA